MSVSLDCRTDALGFVLISSDARRRLPPGTCPTIRLRRRPNMPRVDREGRNEYRRERYAANIERERAKGREKMRRLRTANRDVAGRGRANALWSVNNTI